MDARFSHPGDSGESKLSDGVPLPKDHPAFEALGALDELAAALGVVRSDIGGYVATREARAIRDAQRVLLAIGAEIAARADSGAPARVSESDVNSLDELEADLRASAPSPGGFVLPGATLTDARIHVARAACRTAERRVVSCLRDGRSRLEPSVRYLNRLSGCLFWLALRFGRDL